MQNSLSYRILSLGLRLGLGIALYCSVASAQQSPKTPTQVDLYCAGMATDQPVPSDTYVISGEDSRVKDTFHPGDLVYINKGGEQGVKVGDQFEVIRPIHDRMPNMWFKPQEQLNRAMGTTYGDIGRLRVVNVLAKTSVATLTLACDMMQRGDIVRPFVERQAPAYHTVAFDAFAPPSGKKTAMIVNSKVFGALIGSGQIVYVNLGSAQGVQIGDYFRIFRYQGENQEMVYQVSNTAYKMYGFGSTPVRYEWDNLPRQIMGEGIVLRTGPNSSTVLLTTTREEIFAGDYVELE